jgi:hypothetical protein
VTAKRLTLRLPSQKPTAEHQAPLVVDVNVLHLRLPCRSFRVSYKVAEPGKFSLTTEFLLRLLRFTNRLREEAIAEFFGFSADETSFVVDHAENFGYVMRTAGRIGLTEAGYNLFVAGSDEPALFEVQTKRDRFDFDLIAFAPAEWQKLSPFEYELPELGLTNIEETANASQYIISSFKRHFQEFQFKRGGSRIEKQSLYSVDAVHPDNRFSIIVPVTLSIRSDNPSFPEANMLSWKTGFELEDRAAVVQSCAAFVKANSIAANGFNQEAAKYLARCAPDQISRFFRNEVFDPEAFFRSTVRQVGELRSDRPTVRVIGNVWTDANRTRFASALKSAAAREERAPSMVFWLKPASSLWGMTTRLQDILGAVTEQFVSPEEGEHIPLRTVLISDEEPLPRFKKAFNAVAKVPSRCLPRGLEIFLVPGRLVFVLVHTSIGVTDGYPVPLGIVSFDPKVVERTHGIITDIMSAAESLPAYCDWALTNFLDEVDTALEFSTGGIINEAVGRLPEPIDDDQ